MRKSQLQIYWEEHRKIAESDRMWMEMMKHDPPTKSEFDKLLEMRPDIYSRYAGFRDKLPDSR